MTAERRAEGPERSGAATPRKQPEQPGTHGGRRPNAGGSGQIVPAESRAKAQRPRTLDLRIVDGFGGSSGTELDQFGRTGGALLYTIKYFYCCCRETLCDSSCATSGILLTILEAILFRDLIPEVRKLGRRKKIQTSISPQDNISITLFIIFVTNSPSKNEEHYDINTTTS